MRFFFPLVLLFTAIGLSIYAYLGGLRTPTTALETTTAPVLLAGQPFHGKVSDAAFGELFRAAKRWQEVQPTPPPLANIYYNDPGLAHDSIRAFVGVVVTDTATQLPAGWHYYQVPAGQRVAVARLAAASYLVAPGKLEAAVEQAIKAAGLRKQPPYLEQFGPGEASELRVGVK